MLLTEKESEGVAVNSGMDTLNLRSWNALVTTVDNVNDNNNQHIWSMMVSCLS